MTTFKAFGPDGQPVSNQGFWVAEVGRCPRYARKSDAEEYERGWRGEPSQEPELRGAYLEGIWDREGHEATKAAADTEGGSLD